MNLSAIYSKTSKGARALASKNKTVPANAMRILPYIDGKTDAGAIYAQLSKISEDKFSEAILYLIGEGCIKEIGDDYLSQSLSDFDIHTPIVVAEISAEEFMQIESAAENADNQTKLREKAEADARAQAYAEQQRKLEQEALQQEEAERRLLNVTDILAKSSGTLDIERLAANEPRISRTEAEEKARAKHRARKRRAADEARHTAQQLESIKASALVAPEAKSATGTETPDKRIREEGLQQAIPLAGQHHKEELEANASRDAQSQLTREAETTAALQAKSHADALAIQQAQQLALETDKRMSAELAAHKEIQAQTERLVKRKAAQQAKDAKEAHLKQQAAERAQRQVEKQARAAADKQAKAERKARVEALARTELEAKLKLKAEQQARHESEANIRAEAKALARREAEQQARIASEVKALEKAEREQKLQNQRKIKAATKRDAKRRATADALAKAEEKAQYRATHPAISYQPLLLNALKAAKTGLICFGVAVVLFLIFLPFINLGFLIAPVQNLASKSIAEPVSIDSITISYWPSPHFVIGQASVGSLGDIKAGPVKLYPVFATLSGNTIEIKKLEIAFLKLDENMMQRPLAWLKNMNQSTNIKFAHMRFDNTILTWQGRELPAMDSVITFDKAGEIQKAALTNEAGNLRISIIPASNGYALDIEAQAWHPPLGPALKFDALKAKGLLVDDQLQLAQIEGQLYKGTLNAYADIAWSDEWTVKGKFALSKVDLAQVATDLPAMTLRGQLDMNAVFSLQAAELNKLLDNPVLDARFSALNGKIIGVDLVRAMHAEGNQTINGVTPFEQLTGDLTLRTQQYQFRNLALKAHQLQARGELDVFPNQDISGSLDVKLAVKSRPLQSRIQLTGKVAQPSVK